MTAEVHPMPAPEQVLEEHVAAAVAHLRERMPKHFILLYANGDESTIVSHCSLDAARQLLQYGITQIQENYALNTAKRYAG